MYSYYPIKLHLQKQVTDSGLMKSKKGKFLPRNLNSGQGVSRGWRSQGGNQVLDQIELYRLHCKGFGLIPRTWENCGKILNRHVK